ncbi:MAG: PDZ domain-containing protein [Planctomycetota bacterium]|nr:PDZ domain-containing protein [Planctomycetota bacterium]
MKRTLGALLFCAAFAAADEGKTAAKPTASVVGVRARVTRTVSFGGRSRTQAMIYRQVGIVIGKGHILTTSLGDNAENVRIFMPGSTEGIEAEVVESDTEFSVLKAEELEAPAMVFSKRWTGKVGGKIQWLGFLPGSVGKWTPVVKEASIDAILEDEQTGSTNFFSDPPFTRGLVVMRCALILADGQAVGIVTEHAAQQDAGGGRGRRLRQQSMPLIRPATAFAHYLDGTIGKRGILGIRVEDMGEKIADAMGLKDVKGVIVTQVTPGSAAEKAGILAQDVVVKIDEHEITGGAALRRALQGKAEGTKVTVTFMRIGDEGPESMTVEAVLTAKEESDSKDRHRAKRFGFVSEPLTSNLRAQFGLDADVQGVHVRRVTRGSPAAMARPTGLRRGDVILKVGDLTISSVDALKEVLKAIPSGTPAIFFVRHAGDTRFVEITPEDEG